MDESSSNKGQEKAQANQASALTQDTEVHAPTHEPPPAAGPSRQLTSRSRVRVCTGVCGVVTLHNPFPTPPHSLGATPLYFTRPSPWFAFAPVSRRGCFLKVFFLPGTGPPPPPPPPPNRPPPPRAPPPPLAPPCVLP